MPKLRFVFSSTLIGVVLFLFLSNLFAQDKYLVKIEKGFPDPSEKLKKTEASIYAKTPEFFIGVAELKDLDYLQGEGVGYQILDEQLEMGRYYLIRSRKKEEVRTYLERIKRDAEVLYFEDDFAIVKAKKHL